MQGLCQPSNEATTAVAGRSLAPLWHTRLLVCVLLLAPATSLLELADVEAASASTSQVAGLYLPLLLANIAFAAYVSRIGLGRSMFWDLFGSALRGRRALVDVLGGVMLAGVVVSVDSAILRWSGGPESLASHALLPTTARAKLWWLAIAATTGFAEELLYRGYLQRQLSALSGSALVGITFQALLFGIAHGLQGGDAVLRYAAYGFAFGVVSRQRRGLLPVVVCHVTIDAYAGLGG